MPKFDVEAFTTIYVHLFLEAGTKEEAEALAKEQIEGDWNDFSRWNEYISERDYNARELKE
jgi:hypothetical protein